MWGVDGPDERGEKDCEDMDMDMDWEDGPDWKWDENESKGGGGVQSVSSKSNPLLMECMSLRCWRPMCWLDWEEEEGGRPFSHDEEDEVDVPDRGGGGNTPCTAG